MTEYMTLEVDEMNARAKELAEQGKYLTTEELQKKRDYMEAVKKASDLRRKNGNRRNPAGFVNGISSFYRI